MRWYIFVFFIAILLSCKTQINDNVVKGSSKSINVINAPVPPKGAVVETYFGIEIKDDYRNLENVEDPEVKKWLKSESEHADKYLNRLPGVDYLTQKMMDYISRDSVILGGRFFVENDAFFYMKKEIMKKLLSFITKPDMAEVFL